MKPRVYVESTVISYLTARASSNLLIAARQRWTQLWWDERRNEYETFVSPVVIREISLGDGGAAFKRKEAINGIAILEPKAEIEPLSSLLLKRGSLPVQAGDDALHIAWAACYQIDYLLTWNFAHIANPVTRKIIEATVREAGYFTPTICTPEELLGGQTL